MRQFRARGIAAMAVTFAATAVFAATYGEISEWAELAMLLAIAASVIVGAYEVTKMKR